AGVDQVCQRHASLRSRSFAFDSVSNALATRCCRFGATRRSASLTVSFKVFVPSSARAAARARSSMSTNRLAMTEVYQVKAAYILGKINATMAPAADRRALSGEGANALVLVVIDVEHGDELGDG